MKRKEEKRRGKKERLKKIGNSEIYFYTIIVRLDNIEEQTHSFRSKSSVPFMLSFESLGTDKRCEKEEEKEVG